MTFNMYVAFFAWLLLSVGIINRRHPKTHIPCVLSGIGLDFSLVIYLQFTKDAVQKAVSFDLELLPQLHIGASLAAMCLYIPTIYFGVCLLKERGDQSLRRKHKIAALSAYAFRTLGFVLMFSMIK